jgi:phosphate butyryltransferase
LSFADILSRARNLGMRRFVAAQAADPVVIEAVEAARREGFCAPVLVGVRAESAGIIVGARAPIVVTSRSDSAAGKLNSMALAVLCAAGA